MRSHSSPNVRHTSFLAGLFAAGVAHAWQRPALYTGRKINSAGFALDGDGVQYDILDQGKDNIRIIADKGTGPVYANSMILYDSYTSKFCQYVVAQRYFQSRNVLQSSEPHCGPRWQNDYLQAGNK